MANRSSLQRMLRPQSAVFIGGSVIEEAIDYTRFNNFDGAIYVVNPLRETLAGLPCYPTLADLPAVPDIAYIGVPKNLVVETIQALSEIGCGGAVCDSSGFSEIEGEGVGLQAAFVGAAGDMPVIGPNCPGMANYLDNAVFMQGYFGDFRDVSAGVAVISNGGAYLSDVGTCDRSVPLAYSVGLGNQAMLNVADLFDAIIEDERVQAVNLYLESIRDVPKLSRAALKAMRKGVPVVVVKGGNSAAGQRATQTHTASLAGDSIVTKALFERLGFITCNSPEEALETLKMLIFTRRPSGNKLAFSTSSGSYAVMGSDAAESFGLELPSLTPELTRKLARLLPDYILPSNPLDISNGQYFDTDTQRKIFKTLFSGEFDIGVQVMCFPPEGGWDPETWVRSSSAFAAEAAAANLPCAFVNTLSESLPKQARELMIANGMAPLQGLRNGFLAIGNAVKFAQQQEERPNISDSDILIPAIPHAAGPITTLDEAAAKERLAQFDIPIPNSQIIEKPLSTSLNINYPVVLKAVAPNLLHKTELGAVMLPIPNEPALQKAINKMHTKLARSHPKFSTGRFLVEEMVQDVVAELLVGIRYVEGIGFAMTLAIGGITVELLQDSATLILPTPRKAIEQALRQLKLFPLLDGYRGKPKADLSAALEAIEAMAHFALDNQQRVETLEVNPLLVCESGAFAADAVLTVSTHE